MSHLRILFLLAAGLLLGASPMLAANYAVGTCKPSLPSYATISAAVSGVPPFSTVLVCPGTYPDQVTIAQPLTLKGITSANAGQAVITVPGSGLSFVTTGLGYSIAAMVNITASPVNISDITVDGAGNTLPGGSWFAGFLYNDGSSGTVNSITARNLCCTYGGFGVWAENANATYESLTIENSSFHDFDDSAVITFGNTLVATLKGNTVEFGYSQIQFYSGGSLTANVLNGGYFGMFVTASAPATVSGNTVNNETFGIFAGGGITATSNKISNACYGIYDGSGVNFFYSNATTTVSYAVALPDELPTVVAS